MRSSCQPFFLFLHLGFAFQCYSNSGGGGDASGPESSKTHDLLQTKGLFCLSYFPPFRFSPQS